MIAVAACQRAEVEVSELSQETSAQARRTIVRWLECEECTDGELEAVLKLGRVAVPTLATTVLEGPAPVRLEELREHLTASYRQQAAYARSHPRAASQMSESEYLAVYTANLVARYRIRSAMALERFGGPEAAQALERALAVALRDDERGVIAAAAARVRR